MFCASRGSQSIPRRTSRDAICICGAWPSSSTGRKSCQCPRMADIEADMGELHAQIAVATRRLETSVEQMKSKTTSQLSEIGKSSEAIARLRAEYANRSSALAALADKEKALHAQLRLTEAELAARSTVLAEVERKLAQEKAELNNLLAFVDARERVAETEKRHSDAMEELRARNRELEEQLGASYDERIRLEQEMTIMKRQVETTWATERMAHAVLRERINDVAGEVVRVAHALEGLGSPMDTMIAGTASELVTALAGPGIGSASVPSISTGGEDSKGSLAYRIRSLQKRAARVASNGGT